MISGTWRLGQIAGQHDEVVCGDHHHSERNTGGCSSRQVLALAPSGRLPKKRADGGTLLRTRLADTTRAAEPIGRHPRSDSVAANRRGLVCARLVRSRIRLGTSRAWDFRDRPPVADLTDRPAGKADLRPVTGDSTSRCPRCSVADSRFGAIVPLSAPIPREFCPRHASAVSDL